MSPRPVRDAAALARAERRQQRLLMWTSWLAAGVLLLLVWLLMRH